MWLRTRIKITRYIHTEKEKEKEKREKVNNDDNHKQFKIKKKLKKNPNAKIFRFCFFPHQNCFSLFFRPAFCGLSALMVVLFDVEAVDPASSLINAANYYFIITTNRKIKRKTVFF